jgi:hypothetical protein
VPIPAKKALSQSLRGVPRRHFFKVTHLRDFARMTSSVSCWFSKPSPHIFKSIGECWRACAGLCLAIWEAALHQGSFFSCEHETNPFRGSHAGRGLRNLLLSSARARAAHTCVAFGVPLAVDVTRVRGKSLLAFHRVYKSRNCRKQLEPWSNVSTTVQVQY